MRPGPVVVPRRAVRAIRRAARRAHPREACGVLLLQDRKAVRCVELPNHDGPGRFRASPRDAARIARHDGDLALWHTHPGHDPTPSREDVDGVGEWEGRPYLVYAAATGELSGWLVVGHSLVPLPVLYDL